MIASRLGDVYFSRYQMFGASDEIEEGVFLLQQPPVFVPGLPQIPASANVRDRIDETPIEQLKRSELNEGSILIP
jgi:hypothetical protein